MFWSCSEVVWALFLALKCPILGAFSARKVDIRPLKSKFRVKFWPSERAILTIFGAKKVVFWTFSKLFWSGSGVVSTLVLASKGQFCVNYQLKASNIILTHSRSSPLGSRGCPTHKKNPKDFDWLENYTTPKKHVFFFYCVGGGGGRIYLFALWTMLGLFFSNF